MISKEQASPVSINLLAAAAEKTHPSPCIPVFRNDVQTGHLFFPDSPSLSMGESTSQQTLQVLRGSARMRIGEQSYDLRKGHVVVVPPQKPVAFSSIEQEFLVFGLSSPASKPQAAKTNSKLIVENLFELHSSAERSPFMSTAGSNSDQTAPSEVEEVEVFFPKLVKQGFALNGSQAGRLLIYEKETTLDRHTHPLAQHAIYVLAGHGSVEFEGEKFDLTPGGLFVVPPNSRHQLGSYGNFLAFVVNTPGIPPTHDHYSKPA